MFSTSCITPWPATAASPWISTGSTWSPVASPRRCWRARTEPSTTGFTTSRCDGLNASVRCIGPPGVDRRRDEKPWWYLTSPAGQLLRVLALELGEQVGRHLAQRVDQHVEAAAVRHADHRLLHAGGARLLDQVVEHRDHRVAALAARSASGRRTWCADSARASPPRSAARGCAASLRRSTSGRERIGSSRCLDEALGRRVRDVHVLGAEACGSRCPSAPR